MAFGPAFVKGGRFPRAMLSHSQCRGFLKSLDVSEIGLASVCVCVTSEDAVHRRDRAH